MGGFNFYNSFKSILVLLSALFIISNGRAQEFTGDILLKNQAELDAFNYIKVSGTVIIEEETPGGITNVDGLSELVRAFKLSIRHNSVLNNLNGLSGLTALDTLEIIGNSGITNLNGFSKLTTLAHLFLQDNIVLSDINGLSHVTTIIWGHLEIINNPLLQNIDALKIIGKTSITHIEDNASLLNIDGLSGLVCTGHIYIKNNPSLQNINGLHKFENVGQFFEIINNDALTNLDSLMAFYTVQELTIQDNDALTDIKGLSHIEYAFHLRIINNDALINIDPLYPRLKHAWGITINDNALLQNLNGLGKLEFVEFVFNVKDNPMLTDIKGLSALYDCRVLNIKNNTSLSEFCGLFTAATGAPTNSFYISGNAVNPTKEQIAAAGICGTISGTDVSSNNDLPSEYSLKQNYPNPFNPLTTIEYDLPEAAFVSLTIYNPLGKLIHELDDYEEAGKHHFVFDAADLPAGSYFYRLKAGSFTKTNKMIFLK